MLSRFLPIACLAISAHLVLPNFAISQTPKARITTAENLSFDEWLKRFRAEAAATGIREDILDIAFANVRPVERVYQLQDNQPEFARGIWDYLDSAVSDVRVNNGKTQYARNKTLIDKIGREYGVAPETITAIWGLESAYGAVMGDNDTIAVLASLAHKGRRKDFARSQLIGALTILQNNYAPREALKGSWAGAMGHTQFIPTTYLSHGVDYDGDGKRDIWSNLGDVFASTANYLSASGYKPRNPPAIEVILPEGFNYAISDGSVRKPLVEWASAGVISTNAKPLLGNYDPNLRGGIIVPAGANGPAFMVFSNFDAILQYNRSTSYALAVTLLGQKIANKGGDVVQPWPRTDKPLSLTQRKQLQQALTDKGFNPGPVDGIIGAGTKRALRKWQQTQGIPADGYASLRVLMRILG